MYAGTVALPKAAAAARAAVALLEPLAHSDPGLAASALGAKVRADLFLGRGFDADTAMQALAYERVAPPATVDTRTVFRLGQWLRYADDFDGARERLRQAEEQARDEGDDSSFANILLNRVILETWSGALVDAAELAEQMMDAFAQQGLRAEGPNVWQVYVDAFAGRFEAVRAAAAAVGPQEPVVKALWQRTTGLAELAAGEPDAADRHLSEALAGFDRIHFREPAVWRIDGDAIEVALVVGNVEKAKARLVRFEDCAQRSGIPWSLAVSRRCRGLVHAAEGELEAANRLMEEALVEHERCPMPFEQARTLLAHGQVLRRLKRKRFAREALDEAGAIFVRIGADPWLRRVDDELRRVAVRQAPHDLSPTERQIARLAAEGLTNRAIAERAFVSVKTVETNLKRAYRKLGISARAQLAHALDHQDTRAIS